MNITGALLKMEEIERKASRFYKLNHARFLHDPEAAGIFLEMQVEENRHVGLVLELRKMAEQAPELFARVDLPEKGFVKILAVLEMELSSMEQLSLEETLNVAVNLECSLSEGYLASLQAESNPFLSDLCKALGDMDHTEAIIAFKRKRTGG